VLPFMASPTGLDSWLLGPGNHDDSAFRDFRGDLVETPIMALLIGDPARQKTRERRGVVKHSALVHGWHLLTVFMTKYS
jgi:hypothetical protein